MQKHSSRFIIQLSALGLKICVPAGEFHGAEYTGSGEVPIEKCPESRILCFLLPFPFLFLTEEHINMASQK